MLKAIVAVLFLYSVAYSYDVPLTWTAPGDDGNVGTAAQYDIRYSVDSMVLKNWTNAVQVIGEPLPKIAGTKENFTITNLPDPSIATVYMAIKTRDEANNWSLMSNMVNTKLTTDTTRTFTLSWTSTGNDGNVGTAAQYDIRWSYVNITEANWNQATQVNGEPAPLIAGTQQSYLFSALVNKGSTIYVAIKARDNANNWSPLSNVVSSTPLVDTTPPANITDLRNTP